ncbi:hypothetical protein D3C78_1657580 [compost metagenome]
MGAEHGGIQACMLGRQHQGQDFDAVFQQHGKTVAALESLLAQPLRHAQGLLRQLARSAMLVLVGHDDHDPVGSRCCAAKKILHVCHPLCHRRAAGVPSI